MLSVAKLVRRLGVAAPRGGRGVGLSTDEVLRYMRPHGAAIALEMDRDPRDLELLDRALASLPLLVAEERLRSRHPGFARYFDSLPRLVHCYGRGLSCDEIASEMLFIATGFGVETVLRLMADVVAKRVNRG